jgi:hypothetical protein
MNCPTCQSPMSDAALFCPACGHGLKEAATPLPGSVRAIAPEEGHDWLTTLLLSIFLGKLGIHRFYTGHIWIGVLMFLTLGCCGILWIVDLVMILTDSFKDSDGRKLVRKN